MPTARNLTFHFPTTRSIRPDGKWLTVKASPLNAYRFSASSTSSSTKRRPTREPSFHPLLLHRPWGRPQLTTSTASAGTTRTPSPAKLHLTTLAWIIHDFAGEKRKDALKG